MSKYTFLDYLKWLVKSIQKLFRACRKLETSEINVYRGLTEFFIFLFIGIILPKLFPLFLFLGVLRFSYFLWRAKKLNNWT